MTNRELAKTKQRTLEYHFGKYREMWAEEHSDDRALIPGIYDQLMKAAQDMEKVNNTFIWVAFNNHFVEKEIIMCEIIKHFTGRYPVTGSGQYESEYYPFDCRNL